MMKRVRQILRSWYMFFFQLPWLPEAFFSAFDFRIGARSLVRSSRPGTFSSEDLCSVPRRVVAARCANRHDQLVSRALSLSHQISRSHRSRSDANPLGRARRLPFAGNGAGKFALLRRRRTLTFANASHWLQHEEAARVSELLIDFFRS